MNTDSIEIHPLTGPTDADITVPGSKSYTNRALLVAALAVGKSTLTGALFSDDTAYMSAALRELGVDIVANQDACQFDVVGNGGIIPVNEATLYIGNAGTAARSLISYVALGDGRYVIDWDEPMRKSRPIIDLLEALAQLGVDAKSVNDNGCLPVIVNANGFSGGRTKLDASKSSQFLTSLMLTAPYTRNGIDIEMAGDYKTQYIDITTSVMRAFGGEVTHKDYRSYHIPGGQKYAGRDYVVEPDASNASYFFAAAAVTGGRVRVNRINIDSAQGDIHFVDVLEKMGCKVTRDAEGIEVIGPGQLHGIDVDMKEISDTSLTLAAIAPFASSPVHIRNIEHTRWQETNRIAAMVTELRKLGVDVDEHQDGVSISPSTITPTAIDTYDDHRVAVSFALVGLVSPGISINNPECVTKTFPTYFDVLDSIRK
jgi:3-phosphoshikimate 1-carboxyvinyltransferase